MHTLHNCVCFFSGINTPNFYVFPYQFLLKSTSIMKSIILLATLAVFSVNAQSGCELCSQGLQMLWDEALTPEIQTRQVEALIRDVCPQMPEPAGCSVGVLTWWSEWIAPRLFSPVATEYICGQIDDSCNSLR